MLSFSAGDDLDLQSPALQPASDRTPQQLVAAAVEPAGSIVYGFMALPRPETPELSYAYPGNINGNFMKNTSENRVFPIIAPHEIKPPPPLWYIYNDWGWGGCRLSDH